MFSRGSYAGDSEDRVLEATLEILQSGLWRDCEQQLLAISFVVA